LEFIEQGDQVAQIPSETIEAPAHDDIELSSLRCCNQLVERRSTVLRTADTTSDKLHRSPASRLDVASEFLKLVLRLLVERLDSIFGNSALPQRPPL